MSSSDKHWWYANGPDVQGPCTMDELLPLMKQGEITLETWVKIDDWDKWKQVKNVPALWQRLAPPVKQAKQAVQKPQSIQKAGRAKRWWISNGEKAVGPYSAADLLHFLEHKQIPQHAWVRCDGTDGWARVHDVRDQLQHDCTHVVEDLSATLLIIKCFFNYFNFSGRAGRKEFWSFLLFCLLFGALIILMLQGMKLPEVNQYGVRSPEREKLSILYILHFAALLPLFIPLMAVTVRRSHDLEQSAWWVYVFILPSLFCIYLFGATLGNRDNSTIILLIVFMIFYFVLGFPLPFFNF